MALRSLNLNESLCVSLSIPQDWARYLGMLAGWVVRQQHCGKAYCWHSKGLRGCRHGTRDPTTRVLLKNYADWCLHIKQTFVCVITLPVTQFFILVWVAKTVSIENCQSTAFAVVSTLTAHKQGRSLSGLPPGAAFHSHAHRWKVTFTSR